MATPAKKPSATPASIEARKAAVAAAKLKLQQTMAALASAERAAQAKAQAQARRDDTRRKVITGALIQKASEADATVAAYILRLADAGLKRSDERALFGLAPLPEPAPKTATETAPETAAEPAQDAPQEPQEPAAEAAQAPEDAAHADRVDQPISEP